VNDELIATHMTGVAGTIVTYARTADGVATPLRSLTLTGDNATGVFIDTSRDELYVLDAGGAHQSSLLVFARTAADAATPLRALALPQFVPGVGTYALALAVDLAHDEVFVVDRNSNGIRVYARTATGTVPPLRTIIGPATLLSSPNGIALCR
jgi:DNA-binding beta-propeller fold protein YncE